MVYPNYTADSLFIPVAPAQNFQHLRCDQAHVGIENYDALCLDDMMFHFCEASGLTARNVIYDVGRHVPEHLLGLVNNDDVIGKIETLEGVAIDAHA